MTDKQVPDKRKIPPDSPEDDIRPDPALAEMIAPLIARGRASMRGPVFSAVAGGRRVRRLVNGRNGIRAGIGAGLAASLAIAFFSLQPQTNVESVESITASIPREKSRLYEATQVFLAASWRNE